jgi:hypothetical protein
VSATAAESWSSDPFDHRLLTDGRLDLADDGPEAVPTAMLYGRVVEHVFSSGPEFQRALTARRRALTWGDTTAPRSSVARARQLPASAGPTQ